MSWEGNYPAELMEGREMAEGAFVFGLWKSPELFSDYNKVNENGDCTLITPDGRFFFDLGKQLARQGFKSINHAEVEAFLEGRPKIRKKFDEWGGMQTVEEMRSVINSNNVEANFNLVTKLNLLMRLHDKGFNVIQNIGKLKHMSAQEIYDYYDNQLTSISVKADFDSEIETLELDETFISECDTGSAKGIDYGKVCHILNYLTLGLPLGELFMVAGHSGTGKSSFVFESMILPLTLSEVKCAVISNEMRASAFKHLLLAHILTQDLNYWELTRKKIKQGGFTAEQHEMLKKAVAISREKYSNIKFVKLFDNDVGKIKHYMRKLAKDGCQVIFYDTMKSDDEINEAMWQQLLVQSRKLFQLASKENVCLIASYQLALHTLNKRFLDASCLSNAKQIKEVFSEMVYLRHLWDDEYTGEPHDVKPYFTRQDESGKSERIHEQIVLDPEKQYVIAFLDKTRNDRIGRTLLYEFDGDYNIWKELGYCTVRQQDRG